MVGGGLFSRSPGEPTEANGDRVIAIVVLALCLLYITFASIGYLLQFDGGIFDQLGRPIGRDFVNYWAAGVAIFEGKVPLLFDIQGFHLYQEGLLGESFAEHSWSYPPNMLLMIWPLGQLPYLWGLAAWSFLLLSLYLWVSTTGRGDQALLLIALLLAPATYANFSGGQNGFLTAVLMIGGFRLLGRRPILAGVLFGLLTVKPQLGVLLPFALLAARQWSTMLSATVTAVALFALSVAVFGWESWQAYLQVTVPHQSTVMSEYKGVFLAMMPSPYIGLRLLHVDPSIRWAVQGCFSAVALLGVVWTFARCEDQDLRFSALAVGTFLATPYAFNYDMTTVSLAIALLALQGWRQGFLPSERLSLALSWVLPIAILWLNHYIAPIGSLILLASFVYILLRVRQPVAAGSSAGYVCGRANLSFTR
jgi:hypothetical protein